MENENMNFEENKASNNDIDNNENLSEREKKLKDVFGLGGATVKKDLNKSTFFKSVNIPSFLRDYLIGKFTEEDGSYNLEKMSEFIKRYIPNKDEFLQVKDKIIREGKPLEILAKTGVDIDIKTGKNHFKLPQYAVDMKDTIIYMIMYLINIKMNFYLEKHSGRGLLWDINIHVISQRFQEL